MNIKDGYHDMFLEGKKMLKNYTVPYNCSKCCAWTASQKLVRVAHYSFPEHTEVLYSPWDKNESLCVIM